MKKIINAVIGDPKKASPAKKYTVYALLITAVSLALAIVILIASSIAFAISDKKQAELLNNKENEDSGEVVNNDRAIVYATLTEADLDAKKDALVVLSEKRTVLEGGLYYGIAPKDSLKLTSSATDALNDMLVAFYKANQKSLNISTEDDGKCDLPLITTASADGLSFKIERYSNDDKSIAAAEFKNKYNWIFTNARSYGFIYTENSFRYVGTAISAYMNSKKLADYDALVASLKENTSNVSVSVNKVSYQLYYIAKGTELKVPTNYGYTVMANGTDGYIIIVNMSKRVEAPATGN